jgi:hypothetical protein
VTHFSQVGRQGAEKGKGKGKVSEKEAAAAMADVD